MDINSFRVPSYKCYDCPERESCERYECNCCGTCEGELYFFGEELDFSLCSTCLIAVQAKIQSGLEKHSQYSKTNKVNEKITINRKTITEAERKEVFDRDNWRCVLCGDTEYLQVDHKMPFSKGGTTEMSNLQTLCRTCNCKKGNR